MYTLKPGKSVANSTLPSLVCRPLESYTAHVGEDRGLPNTQPASRMGTLTLYPIHGLPAPSFPLGTYNFFVQGHTDTDTETLLHISSPQTLSLFLSLSSQSPSRTTSLLWPYSHSQSSICMHIRPSTEPPSHTAALTALYSASPLNTFFPHTGSLTDSHLQSLLTHILSHTLLPRLRPASHSFYTQCPFNTLHTSRVTHTHSFSLHPLIRGCPHKQPS